MPTGSCWSFTKEHATWLAFTLTVHSIYWPRRHSHTWPLWVLAFSCSWNYWTILLTLGSLHFMSIYPSILCHLPVTTVTETAFSRGHTWALVFKAFSHSIWSLILPGAPLALPPTSSQKAPAGLDWFCSPTAVLSQGRHHHPPSPTGQILQGCLIFFFGSFLWNLSEKSLVKYRFLLCQRFIYLIPPPSILTSANRNILTDDMSCIPEQAQLFLNFTY